MDWPAITGEELKDKHSCWRCATELRSNRLKWIRNEQDRPKLVRYFHTASKKHGE